MIIQHNPRVNIQLAEKLYSEKDGVTVKYVCTSAINSYAGIAADIFYRETPHPKFGNRYFGLLYDIEDRLLITNADKIEDLEFNMVDVDGELHYSQHRHDYRVVGDVAIDGGRSYLRRSGNLSRPVKQLKVKDGVFVDAN